jgi:hypothetical protein
MATLNPMQLINLLKSNDPAMVAQRLIQQNYPNDPSMQKLLELGRQGDTQSINQFAQQYFAQNGRDFQSEFNSFMQMFKGM